MNRFRPWMVVAVAVVAASTPLSVAHAQLFGIGPQIVFDPTAVGKLVSQLGRQAQQIAVAREQLQAQIAALRKLPSPPWRDISVAMVRVDALTRQGQAIAYSLQNVDALFQATFPGTAVTGNAPAAERLQTARTLATLRGTLNAAARTATELPVGVTRLRDMKQRMGAVQGHQQALELNGAISVYSAEQLTLVSQQLAGLANAQAVYFAGEVNERARARENTRAFLATLGRVPSSRPGFSFRP